MICQKESFGFWNGIAVVLVCIKFNQNKLALKMQPFEVEKKQAFQLAFFFTN